MRIGTAPSRAATIALGFCARDPGAAAQRLAALMRIGRARARAKLAKSHEPSASRMAVARCEARGAPLFVLAASQQRKHGTCYARWGATAKLLSLRTRRAQRSRQLQVAMPTARGFEPLRAEPNGFLVHHLNHSVTLSTPNQSNLRATQHKQRNEAPQPGCKSETNLLPITVHIV